LRNPLPAVVDPKIAAPPAAEGVAAMAGAVVGVGAHRQKPA
jgi:hypothetical protein